MSNIFVRPTYQHDPARVSSATTEQGLMVAPPTADEDNVGTLRLRTSGIPTAAALIDAVLQTGGNPSGYALTASSGQGLGAALRWKKSTDSGAAATLHWRGYIDTPYLVRVDYPVAYGTGLGRPSTPRTLPDGYLGFCVHHSPGTASSFKFCRVSTANVASTVDIDATTATSDAQSDFVVLPSGRLVAMRLSGSALTRYESSDYGATWTSSGQIGSATGDVLCLEYAEDVITMVVSSSTAASVTDVRVSQDAGYNWTSVDTTQTLRGVRTCVTATGKILAISTAAEPLVREIAPGGGLSTNTVESNIASNSGFCALVARDDGTIWAFATASTAAFHGDIDASVSVDGGLTFTTPMASGRMVLNLSSTVTTGAFKSGIAAGCWAGKVIVLALSKSGGGGASDYALHMYTFGGWETVTEGSPGSTVYTYDHCMIPHDYPDALGSAPWTRVNTGAGATVTNQGPLRFVSTGANATYYLAPNAIANPNNPGGTYKVRYRGVQVSGGSIASSNNGFRLNIGDGVNRQGFALRFSTTQFQVVDSAGNALSTKTVNTTLPTDFLFAFKHDNIAGASGLLSYWYKQDADETWTLGVAAVALPEEAAIVADGLRVGAPNGVAVAGTHDTYYLGIGDSSETMEGGFTNPDDLAGRPLASYADYYLTSGVHVGGYNALGAKGDAYTVETTYSYGKAEVWEELRPSRHVRATVDSAAWAWVADAGSTDRYRGDTIALFGTNFRTATFEMNATDAWGAPTISVSLDATITSFTVGAGNRGAGYAGPTTSLNWKAGQYKSDGDGHRFFVTIGGVGTYEITDNDGDRVYVKGVDLSAAAGTCYIFGDRMGSAAVTYSQLRYIRVSVASQATADDDYRLGTVIFDRKFEPLMRYGEDHTDRITPNVVSYATESGYQSRTRKGPRTYSTTVMWGPVDRTHPTYGKAREQIADFYSAIEGSLTPVVWWRDTTDVTTLRLVYVEGVYASPNLKGELSTSLARIDQLDLTECL